MLQFAFVILGAALVLANTEPPLPELPTEPEALIRLLQPNCYRGNTRSCQLLLEQVARADGSGKTALEYLGERCRKRKLAEACLAEAEIYIDAADPLMQSPPDPVLPGLTGDVERGARLRDAACRHGEAEACIERGLDFKNGRAGAPKDAAQAGQWFTRAEKHGAHHCEGGVSRGCVALGILHHQGLGRAADPQAAVAYFRKACGLDDAAGCSWLSLQQPGPKKTADGFSRRSCRLGLASECGFWARGLRKHAPPNHLLVKRLDQRTCCLAGLCLGASDRTSCPH